MMRSKDAVALSVILDVGHAVEVRRLDLLESLDAPYLARVGIDIESPDVSPEDLLGRDVTIVWARSSHERRLCGLARSVLKLDEEENSSTFALEVVPALDLLSLRRNTRMFQEKTAVEILEAVLKEALGPYGRDVALELSGEYVKREYCLQYQESDLDFVHRLCEEEGIAYCFDHAGDVELLVLRDSNAAHPRVEGAEQPIVFQPHDLAADGAEAIYDFRREHMTGVTALHVRDFDWTKPAQVLEAKVAGEDARGRTRESYEHGWGRSITITAYDAGAKSYGEHDAEQRTNVRSEAALELALAGHGKGTVIAMAPGRTFELSGHPVAGMDGEYLVTRVRHTTSLDRGDDEAGHAAGYRNELDCIPLDVEHRPRRRTPKPAIGGIQTAIVTGPSGEEIHTDEHGRVKVQFHWDRENEANEQSSCWVRVQQKWAGAGWGFWWLPRIGMEVIVQFADGDPDRPLVTGAVYDASNPTPYPLPDDKTKSTIKSNSTPGGGGFNEFRFEDAAGSEEIFSHAQKDYDEVVENDHTTHVHHDQTNTVDNDQVQTIHNNQTEEVGNDQTMTVDGNRTVHVEGTYDESVDGTEDRTVSGAVTESFSANETRSVGANLTEDVSASETRTVGGSQTETISGNQEQNVAAASSLTISGALTETVAGGITLDTPASWTIDATGGLNITAAAGVKLNAAGGWKVSAPGGVNQVDSSKDWIGQIESKTGNLLNFKWASAFETYVLSFSYTHSKCGFTGAEFPSIGFSIEARQGEFGNYFFDMECCGVWAKKDGAAVED